MSGAPSWAVELYLQNLTLERMMSELQDTLNDIASTITGATGTINDELGLIEQQIAAGATPDLTNLRAAVDGLTNTASRITAVANGGDDPGATEPASDGRQVPGATVDPTAPATVDPAGGDAGTDLGGVQPETVDTAAQTPQ